MPEPTPEQRFPEQHFLGPTGAFPYGKLGEDDGGEIRMAVGSDPATETVVIDFGETPVCWVGMRPEQAEQVAVQLFKHAARARRGDRT